MFIPKNRTSILFKTIAIILVCLFVSHDIAWAGPLNSSTLSPESRLSPVTNKQLTDFNERTALIFVIGELRGIIRKGDVRESHIRRLNIELKDKLRGQVELADTVKTGTLPSGNRYTIAVLNIKKEGREIPVLFLRDMYITITDEDIQALKKLGVNADIDIDSPDHPALKGVWFINPATEPPAQQIMPSVESSPVKSEDANSARSVTLKDVPKDPSRSGQAHYASIGLLALGIGAFLTPRTVLEWILAIGATAAGLYIIYRIAKAVINISKKILDILENKFWKRIAGGRSIDKKEVGQKPTITGVVTNIGALAEEFMREMVLTGVVWKQAIKKDLLFVINNNLVAVDAYAGKLALKSRELGQIAEDFLKELLSNGNGSNENNQMHVASCGNGKGVVISGYIEPREGEMLAKDLVVYMKGQLEKLGNTTITFAPDGMSIESQMEDEKAKDDIRGFIRGFRNIILFSDTHVAGKGLEDNFGAEKEKELIKIIEWANSRRSLIIINGDFLELWEQKYGNIRRSYQALFAAIRNSRRVIYIAGNHDEVVLDAARDERRAEDLKTAKKNIAASKSLNARFADLVAKSNSGKLLGDGYKFVLSDDFSDDGIVLDNMVFYIDREILAREDDQGEAVAIRLLDKLVEDIQQNLSDVIHNDLGSQVEIVRKYVDRYQGIYLEHGHVADPFNYQSWVGHFIASTIGWLERHGWTMANEDLTRAQNAVTAFIGWFYPPILTKQTRLYAERLLAITRVLLGYMASRSPQLVLFFGHTHIPVMLGEGALNEVLIRVFNVKYVNTGTWALTEEVRKRMDLTERWDQRLGIDTEKIAKKGKAAIQPNTKHWFEITPEREVLFHNGAGDIPVTDTATAAKEPAQADIKAIPETPAPVAAQETPKVSSEALAAIAPVALSPAQNEAAAIHNENLKYIPAIPEKTILCHVITDSIVPAEQQNILRVALEQNMEKQARKGTDYREGFACLSGATAGDPDEYINELQSLMQKKRDEYIAMGYTAVRFDVACPDTELVKAILARDIGIKALAFQPCKDPLLNFAQIEGIMLALRALDSGDIEKLKSVFAFLSGNKLSPELSGITNIDSFIKTAAFILPIARIEDYNERRKINDLITTNISQAA
jgi:predicted phosphodiesterase